MTLQDRKLKIEQTYEELKKQRQELVDQAQVKLEEMLRLEGEYRTVNDLIASESESKPSVRVKGEK